MQQLQSLCRGGTDKVARHRMIEKVSEILLTIGSLGRLGKCSSPQHKRQYGSRLIINQCIKKSAKEHRMHREIHGLIIFPGFMSVPENSFGRRVEFEIA